jgi:D-alanyl-D-alanine carboxypeptidase/D-alanyl-D-alanine-endopeptidase (penicillin-binding protein 4)
MSLQELHASAVCTGCFACARVGAAVDDLSDGHVVNESNSYLPLEPASTMKVLTTAAALDRFGADWRYATNLYASGPVEAGVLKGDLHLRGAGAPDLVIERWDEIAAEVAALGIRSIEGSVVGDDSFFDGERRPPGWPSSTNASPYNSPISSLSANFNTVRVSVLPTRSGQKPTVLVEPRSLAVVSVNRARTGKRTALNVGRSWNGRQNTVTVSGTIGSRSGGLSEYVSIEDPALVATAVLQRSLESAGIVVKGRPKLGPVPQGAALLWSHSSKPLWEILADTNKNSNNFMAECLHRTLGAEVYGAPGDRAKGSTAVDGFLERANASRAGLVLFDGSGLSHANRVTARTLLDTLVAMHADPDSSGWFFATLPVGGVDGTLAGRLRDVAGMIHAKTGTISGARGLAGYVTDPVGRPRYAFAIIVNDYRCGESAALAGIDAFARTLALDTFSSDSYPADMLTRGAGAAEAAPARTTAQ